MLKSIEKALKLSEIREKLNDLNAIADPTTEQKTEERDLLASQKTDETEYRIALQAEDDARTSPTTPDTEERERQALVERASLGAIFSAAVEHRSPSGAESELQAALSLASNQIPVDLLRARKSIARSPRHRRMSVRPSNRS